VDFNYNLNREVRVILSHARLAENSLGRSRGPTLQFIWQISSNPEKLLNFLRRLIASGHHWERSHRRNSKVMLNCFSGQQQSLLLAVSKRLIPIQSHTLPAPSCATSRQRLRQVNAGSACCAVRCMFPVLQALIPSWLSLIHRCARRRAGISECSQDCLKEEQIYCYWCKF